MHTQSSRQLKTRKIRLEEIHISQGERVLLVDGSWDPKYGAGIAMAVYNRRGDLIYVSYAHVEVSAPFQAETEAMWMAMR